MGNHREAVFYGGRFARVRALLERPRVEFVRLVSDEGGQSVLEYILILSATVIGAGLMSQKILQAIDSGILSLGGQLEKDLKTGRAPLDIWKN